MSDGNGAVQVQDPVLHIRFRGESFDIPLSDLDIGPVSDDETIKGQLSTYLDLDTDIEDFRDYQIDRHGNGNFTVRPHAVFG